MPLRYRADLYRYAREAKVYRSESRKEVNMIRITLLTGPFAGSTRTSAQVPSDIDPMAIVADIVRHGWGWSIDWSQATTEEAFLWGRADFVCRILRALAEGRPVRFLGRVYGPAANADELATLVGKVEDAVAESGRNVFILADDAFGLTVGVHGHE